MMKVRTGIVEVESVDEAIRHMLASVEQLNSEGFFPDPESYEKAKQNILDSRPMFEMACRTKMDS